MGLVQVSGAVHGTGPSFWSSGWVWTKFLQHWVGLDYVSGAVDGIGLGNWSSGWEKTKFLV